MLRLVIVAAVAYGSMATPTPEECFLTFQTALMDPNHVWYNESSEMTLAQSGVYRGMSDILEYASLVSADSAGFDDFAVLPGGNVTLKAVAGEECVILNAYTLQLRFSELAFAPVRFNITLLSKAYWSPSHGILSRTFLYYPLDVIDVTFRSMLNTDAMRGYVCGLMQSKCLDVWPQQGFASTQECVDALARLPVLEGELGHFDGNSFGCRIVHSGLISFMPSMHCPHVSLSGIADPLGRFKCQASSMRSPDDLFDDVDMEHYGKFVRSNDYPILGDIGCTATAECPVNFVCYGAKCVRLAEAEVPTLTCREVKAAFRANSCCGSPDKRLALPSSRRLSGSAKSQDAAALLASIGAHLDSLASARGASAVRDLAARIQRLVEPHLT